jgi:two-component system sensor histidine kinase UhpB
MALPTPLDLPRLLLRGAALVLIVAWLLAAALGLWRAAADAERETGAAMVLVATLRDVAQVVPGQEAALVERLRATQGERWRHLRLTLRDAEGRVVFASEADADGSPQVAWLAVLLRGLTLQPDPAPLALSLPARDGPPWTLVLSPSADKGRREAVVRLFQLLGVLGAGALLLLVLLRWQLHRAFRPLRALLAAIGSGGTGGASLPLPPMPVRELQVIAEALAQADAQRRLLAQRLQTLQEDERRRLAQELHDELGQRLTALRMDATVLRRGLQDGERLADPGVRERLAAMAAGLSEQVGAAQIEVRELLVRLAPRIDEEVSGARLAALLASLARAQRSLRVDLHGPDPQARLPASLMLAVYRLSQEGLTNVVRHAQARHAWLTVRIEEGGVAGGDGRAGSLVHWRLADDGVGLPDIAAAFERGSGLAGMRERVWAFGGHLEVQDGSPGLVLQATLRAEAVPPPAAGLLSSADPTPTPGVRSSAVAYPGASSSQPRP